MGTPRELEVGQPFRLNCKAVQLQVRVPFPLAPYTLHREMSPGYTPSLLGNVNLIDRPRVCCLYVCNGNAKGPLLRSRSTIKRKNSSCVSNNLPFIYLFMYHSRVFGLRHVRSGYAAKSRSLSLRRTKESILVSNAMEVITVPLFFCFPSSPPIPSYFTDLFPPLRNLASCFFVLQFFSQQINEKPQVVGEYESGKAIPNPQLISKLERALGVRLPRPAKKGKK